MFLVPRAVFCPTPPGRSNNLSSEKKVTDQQGYHLTTYSSHPSFAAPLTWPSQTRPPHVFQHVALPTISYPSWGRNHVIEYSNTMYSKCSLILSCHRCSSFPQRNSFLDDSCYAARFSWPNVNKQGGTHKKRVMQWCRMFAPHRSSRVLDRFYSPLFLFSPPLFFFSSFLLFRCIQTAPCDQLLETMDINST